MVYHTIFIQTHHVIVNLTQLIETMHIIYARFGGKTPPTQKNKKYKRIISSWLAFYLFLYHNSLQKSHIFLLLLVKMNINFKK